VSSPVQAVRLRIGDRVRFSGTVRTVIGLSGTVVRLADPGGTLTELTLAELVNAGDFERVGVPPPAPLPSASPLDGLPGEAVAEALWWERHIVEVLRGIPSDAPPGAQTYPLMRETLRVTPERYERWLASTWRRMAVAATHN
jgi:hypothetical protein